MELVKIEALKRHHADKNRSNVYQQTIHSATLTKISLLSVRLKVYAPHKRDLLLPNATLPLPLSFWYYIHIYTMPTIPSEASPHVASSPSQGDDETRPYDAVPALFEPEETATPSGVADAEGWTHDFDFVSDGVKSFNPKKSAHYRLYRYSFPECFENLIRMARKLESDIKSKSNCVSSEAVTYITDFEAAWKPLFDRFTKKNAVASAEKFFGKKQSCLFRTPDWSYQEEERKSLLKILHKFNLSYRKRQVVLAGLKTREADLSYRQSTSIAEGRRRELLGTADSAATVLYR